MWCDVRRCTQLTYFPPHRTVSVAALCRAVSHLFLLPAHTSCDVFRVCRFYCNAHLLYSQCTPKFGINPISPISCAMLGRLDDNPPPRLPLLPPCRSSDIIIHSFAYCFRWILKALPFQSNMRNWKFSLNHVPSKIYTPPNRCNNVIV